MSTFYSHFKHGQTQNVKNDLFEDFFVHFINTNTKNTHNIHECKTKYTMKSGLVIIIT